MPDTNLRRAVASLHRRVNERILATAVTGPAEQRQAPSGPLVSVVIPIYNVEPYLKECLASITAQTHHNLDIVIVDDGSTDGSLAIAGSAANCDRRIRVISQANSGPAVARNVGADSARGDYITFVDADDSLPSTALERMVAASEASGSDVVVGAIERTRNGRSFQPEWVQRVHAVERLGIVLKEYPRILRNFYTGSKMFRRSFWVEHSFAYREGTLFEDQPLITETLCLATAIDVLHEVTYSWRIRDDGSSRSQGMYSIKHIEHRHRAIELTAEVIERMDDQAIRDAWLWTLLESHFPGYLRQSLRLNGPTYSRLVEMIAATVDTADIDRVDGISAQNKVLLQLALTCPKPAVDEFLLSRGYDLRHCLLHAERGVVTADLPRPAGAGSMPEEFYRIDADQMTLACTLRSASWTSSTRLRLTGWAYITACPMPADDSTIDVWMLNTFDGTRLRATLERTQEPGATVEAGSRFNSYDVAGFSAEFDFEHAGEMPSDSGVVGEWIVEASVTAAGVSRTGTITRRSPNSSAAFLRSSMVTPGLYARPQWSAESGLGVTMARRPFGVEGVRESAGTTILTIRRNYGRTVPVAIRAIEKATSKSITLSAIRKGDGRWAAVVEHSRVAAGTWRFQVVTRGRDSRYVHASDYQISHDAADSPTVGLSTNGGNQLELTTRKPVCRIDHVEALGVNELLLRGEVLAAGAIGISFQLAGKRATSTTARASVTGRRFEVRISLTYATWNRTAPALPVGYYRLTAAVIGSSGSTTDVRVDVAPPIFDTMPVDSLGLAFFGRLYLDYRGQCNVQILTPMTHRERSQFAMQTRTTSYRSAHPELEDAVYYQCLEGGFANDSQLAVHDWFAANRDDVRQYWGISDYSVPVPPGAVPVLINSAEWFDVLARSRYLCVNHELPNYFVKKPGQVVVQTYHGHPFKLMGVPRWQRLGVTQTEIDANVRRRDVWDILLSPSPAATQMYRSCFPVRAEIAEVGHPRNDALVLRHDALRAGARAELGLAEDDRVVLYAPTYRDTAGSPWESKMVDVLNPDNLQRALGDDYVVLLRAHASNVRYATRKGQALSNSQNERIVDVSEYPNINGLIAASDLGIFDYSSIRFDYSVTGKPMFFFVPDRAEYFGNLPPLMDYDQTTPGPQVGNLIDLRDQVLDLVEYQNRFAAAYKEFTATFNPYEDGLAAGRLAERMLAFKPTETP